MPFQSIRTVEADGPYDGVPPWLVDPLYRWIDELMDIFSRGSGDRRKSIIARFDMLTKASDPMAPQAGKYYVSEMLATRADSEIALDFASYMLSIAEEWDIKSQVTALRTMLDESGSVWTVGKRDRTLALTKRVPDAVQTAASEAMSVPGDAGPLLREAWSATFGRGPDYEKAYAKSVKAVEAAAVPLVSPKNIKATLGTVISDMKNQKDWRLGMTRDVDAPSQQLVLDLAQRLWTGQNDRHAGQVGYQPSSKEDAEAAVTIAVVLVQWFASGALVRRP